MLELFLFGSFVPNLFALAATYHFHQLNPVKGIDLICFTVVLYLFQNVMAKTVPFFVLFYFLF